jgi:hypothetical protein
MQCDTTPQDLGGFCGRFQSGRGVIGSPADIDWLDVVHLDEVSSADVAQQAKG